MYRRVLHFAAYRKGDLSRVHSAHFKQDWWGVHTSFNSLTFELRPSNCSSFCPSKSSANRVPPGCCLYSSKGDERPEDGGVTPRRLERSRREFVALTLMIDQNLRGEDVDRFYKPLWHPLAKGSFTLEIDDRSEFLIGGLWLATLKVEANYLYSTNTN